MATYVFSGISIARDGLTDDVTSIQTSELAFVFSDDVPATFSYSVETPPQIVGDDLPEVSFDGNFIEAVVNGQSNNDPGFFFDDDNDIIEFGIVNYDDGNAQNEDRAILVVVINDASENTEYVYQLDSIPGSTIPDFDAIAAANPGNPEQAKINAFIAFDNQITTVQSPEGAGLVEGDDILAGDFTDGTLVQDDVFFGSEFGDFADLGEGNDFAEGNGGDDTLIGGDGNDTLVGRSGNDDLIGGAGDDVIETGGGEGSDFVQTGTGNDFIQFDGGFLNDAFVSFSDLDYGDTGPGDANLTGITVYINEAGESDRVEKGAFGTTAFGDVNEVIGSDGLGLEGTTENDTFFITNTESDGFIAVRGGDGVDTYNFGDSAGTVRFDLRGGVDAIVDLSLVSNQVIDDGYGNTESIGDVSRIREVRATDGNDSLIGSTGNDRFITRKGSDTVEAGDGFDTIRYDRSIFDSVTVDLQDARSYDNDTETSGGYASGFWSDGGGSGAFETFISDVEYVRGSREGNDVLLGDGNDNRFDGRGGNDTLNGRDGNDTLRGEDGDDELIGGSGSDELSGGSGLDIFVYSGGNDTITDFDLSEEIVDLSSWGFASEQEESEFLINNISDSGGDAVIDFGGGNSLTLQGFTAQQVIDEINNDDGGGGGNPGDDIFGTEFDDNFDNSLEGTSASEKLFGLAGEDWFIGSLGNDTIDGGSSNQDVIFYDFNNSFNGIFINNTNGEIDGVAAFTVDKGVGFDTLINIENFHGSDGNDTIYAGNSGTYVFDRAGDDEIFAGDTPDTGNGLTFAAGSGSDTMWGSTFDDDIVDYSDDTFDAAGLSFQGVTVDLVNGTATDGWGGQDELNSIEWVRGSQRNDTIEGDDGDNFLEGNDGDDAIDGGQGDDNIFGNDGADTLGGGLGDDFVSGGAGNDSIIAGGASGFDFIQTGEGTDTVDFTTASGSYGAAISFEDLDFGEEGFEEENLVGVTFDVNTALANGFVNKGVLGLTSLLGVSDVIESDQGGIDLFGSTENDTFNVGNNRDNSFLALRGGDGADFYNIAPSTGTIRLDFRGGETGVVLNLALSENQVLNDGYNNIEDIDGIAGISEFRTGDGNDLITGSGLNERFITRLGSDTVDGGGGFDTLRYDRSFVDSVVVDLEDAQGGSAGYALGQWTNDGQPDTFETFITDVDAVRGSREGNDEIRGDGEANRFEGRGGNDSLQGRGDNDTLIGEDGNDSLFGDEGNDVLIGGAGNDSIEGGLGNDTLTDGRDTDTLDGGEGIDTFLRNLSDDFDDFAFTAAVDLTLGRFFSPNFPEVFDTLISLENVEMTGNFDHDIKGSGVANVITTGIGADTVLGEGGNDTLLAGDGADDLNGGNGADSLRGGTGSDTLEGGFGNDTMFGDNDADVMTAIGGLNLMFGGFGDDDITGGSATDTLNGGSGADTMDGGNSGDSFIIDGDDVITDTGAVGIDNAQILSQAGSNIDLALWSGVERVNGNIGNDTIDASTQTLQMTLQGGNGDDSLIGGSQADVLLGGANDDVMIGGEGNNLYIGGSGADTMTGGSGDEIFFVGQGGDEITDAGAGFDRAVVNELNIDIAVGGWSGVERVIGFVGNDTIDATGGSEAIVLTGSDGADSLTGTSFNDTFLGGAGNDIIAGGEGNDTIDGGADADQMTGGGGNDLFFVENAGDVVSDGGAGNDVVAIAAFNGLSIDVGSWVSVERIVGQNGSDDVDATGMATALVMLGGNGDDTLTGGSGNDSLIGGQDADVLGGGLGDDLLIGSSGNDTFVFDDGFGQDLVTDYLDETDRFDFAQHSGVNAISDLQINQSGADTIITLAAGGADQIRLLNVTATDLEATDFDFV